MACAAAPITSRDRLLQAKLQALDTLCAIAADLSNPTQARLAATQILKLDPSDLEPEPDEPQPSRVTSKDIQQLADALHASTAALVMPDRLIPPHQPSPPGCLDAPCLDALPNLNPSPSPRAPPSPSPAPSHHPPGSPTVPRA